MTHKIISFLSILLLSLPLVACSTDDSEVETPIYPDNGEENPSSDEVAMISFTHAVPDGYEQEAEKRGSIVRIDYATRDYAEGTGAKRTNTAYVYLPYGYNESQRYNILYFVHGHYSTAASTFEDENGVVRKLLDQMIAHGDIDPMIVVTPYTRLCGCRPLLQGFAPRIGKRPDSCCRRPLPHVCGNNRQGRY